ncbi:MAG TPA: ABC transporter ATP-binding protein [Aquabacterium sp.]|nr:ABC transporter ATP-binding protein [Aquabacterium sp.]
MKQILSLMGKYKSLIVIALVLAFCAALTDQMVPRFMRNLMNDLSGGGKLDQLAFLLLAMAGAYIGAQVLRILQRVVVERAATQLGAELMSTGMSNLIHNSMAWHLEAPVGQIHVRLERSARAIADLLKVAIGDIVGPLMGIGFALVLLFETSYIGGMTAMVVAVALCGITVWQIVNQNGVRIGINRAREILGGEVVDAISNVETVKLYGAEASEVARVRSTSTALGDREFVHHKAMAAFDVAKAVIDQGGFVLVVAAGLWGASNDSIPGSLVLIVLCYQRLMEPLRSLHRIVDEVAERLALAKDYVSLQAIPQDFIRGKATGADCAISLRDVSFTYPKAPKAALSGISVDIPRGARVALVGASGEGKSTLAKLFSGILTATKGSVTVAGRLVQPIELQKPDQRAVSVLTQEVRLFSGTVIENIRYGTTASDEAVIRAAAAAGINDLLFEPDGVPRRIRARGEGVSGGQKQRIGIARVLLRATPIVVLDEPTSAQDPANRAAFFDLVMRAFVDQTVVIITHDSGSLAWATHVLRLVGGNLRLEKGAATPAASPAQIEPAATSISGEAKVKEPPLTTADLNRHAAPGWERASPTMRPA